MKKLIVIGALLAGIFFLGAIGSGSGGQNAKQNIVQGNKVANPAKTIPVCDGTTVTGSCAVDGISYKTYVYHPATAEKTHSETVTTYHEEIIGYCTLCNDGTYSPSCATGRGACSYHRGVAQWNAPISSNMPTSSTKTVIDVPAQDAYYEKVTE